MRKLKEALAQYDAARAIIADETLNFGELSIARWSRERALYRIVAVARLVVSENEGSFE